MHYTTSRKPGGPGDLQFSGFWSCPSGLMPGCCGWPRVEILHKNWFTFDYEGEAKLAPQLRGKEVESSSSQKCPDTAQGWWPALYRLLIDSNYPRSWVGFAARTICWVGDWSLLGRKWRRRSSRGRWWAAVVLHLEFLCLLKLMLTLTCTSD